VEAVCYRLFDQEKLGEAFFRRLDEASLSQAPVLMGALNHSESRWRSNTTELKQTRSSAPVYVGDQLVKSSFAEDLESCQQGKGDLPSPLLTSGVLCPVLDSL